MLPIKCVWFADVSRHRSGWRERRDCMCCCTSFELLMMQLSGVICSWLKLASIALRYMASLISCWPLIMDVTFLTDSMIWNSPNVGAHG